MSYRRSLEDLMIGSFSGGGKADNIQTPPAPVKEQPTTQTNATAPVTKKPQDLKP